MSAPIIIPQERLDDATLRRLVAEFVSRDGTDYGRVETPLEVKIERAIRAIRTGEIVVSFDQGSQTTTLISKDHYQAFID
tara:strand:- start:347 stop:586 length:240 start_codon:yes stop_codon:yes gene_type:complete